MFAHLVGTYGLLTSVKSAAGAGGRNALRCRSDVVWDSTPHHGDATCSYPTTQTTPLRAVVDADRLLTRRHHPSNLDHHIITMRQTVGADELRAMTEYLKC